MHVRGGPLHGVMLRRAYPFMRPGYHMNKAHWNTIALDGSVPKDEIEGCIDESYELVVRRLPKARRAALGSDA